MNIQKIYLGAGCFWGVEYLFQKLEGVIKTEVGYLGGKNDNPTYREVCTGTTGHAEVIAIDYDSEILSLEKILDYFIRLHDPTQLNRQGPDIGTQYRSAIFFTNDDQKSIANNVMAQFNLENSFDKIAATEISPASSFWPGEDYHQDYFNKNPSGHICHFLREKW